jgi:hypothetical protein
MSNANRSYGETLAAGTSAAGIGIDEMEAFTIETIGKFEHGIEQVQNAFHIRDELHAFVKENLVCRFLLVVETHFITETGAAAAHNADPHKIIITTAFLTQQLTDPCKGLVTDIKSAVYLHG